MSAVASATYVLNDLRDIEVDRLHPSKKARPIAAGLIEPRTARVVALVIGAIAFASAAILSPQFALVLATYVGLTLLYTYGLKRIPLLDVAIIGALFSLRVVGGVVLIGAVFSIWLLSFALLFFFSLALVKRHSELVKMEPGNFGGPSGRGYRREDWPLTLVAGISSGIASLVIMLLYISDAESGIGYYARPAWILVIPMAVLLWLLRIWFLAQRGEMHDDPIVFAIGDRYSWLAAGIAATAFLLAVLRVG
jgi:4-hydroxybenzoate polyprenyltransferase